MSTADQADGFYECPWFCPKCGPGVECICTLKPNENSGKGSGSHRKASDMDVQDRIRMPMGYRLSHGFAILRGGDV